jgi:hypothetical protein
LICAGQRTIEDEPLPRQESGSAAAQTDDAVLPDPRPGLHLGTSSLFTAELINAFAAFEFECNGLVVVAFEG